MLFFQPRPPPPPPPPTAELRPPPPPPPPPIAMTLTLVTPVGATQLNVPVPVFVNPVDPVNPVVGYEASACPVGAPAVPVLKLYLREVDPPSDPVYPPAGPCEPA